MPTRRSGVWCSSMALSLFAASGTHRVLFLGIVRSPVAVVGSFVVPSGSTNSQRAWNQPSHNSYYHSSPVLSLTGSNDEEPPSSLSPEDLERWEQLYFQGEARRGIKLSSVMSASSLLQQVRQQQRVRVVTLDLDNTLWKTGKTIAAANDALAQFLQEHGIVQTQRTEVIMGELFQRDKAKYCPMLDPDQPSKSPVLLTQLRKDALCRILEHPDNGYDTEQATEFAEQAFAKWTEARHAAIPSHLASDVVACLDRIAQLSSSDHPILVGAITDGNSDPRNIPILKPYFDFCVNAEQVGVSKPDKRVYHRAMQYIAAHPSLQDLFSDYASDDDDNDNNMQALEERIGPWWVHVGDDFVKDIVAAKNLNMRTVWARELILGKDKPKTDDKPPPPDLLATMGGNSTNTAKLEVQDSKTTKPQPKLTPEQELMEFQKKINEQAVVKMAVGADDYLVDSIRKEFADSVIHNFGQLADVLKKWQDEPPIVTDQPSNLPLEATTNRAPDHSKQATTSQDDIDMPMTMAESPANGILSDDNDAIKTKFCVFCGTKVPMVALFCSSCSKKQPQVE